MSKLVLTHVELADANGFVSIHHRHHAPATGHRFSLGALFAGRLVGVAIVGRPVSRGVDWRTTVEVTRLCTDGTPNVCSFLYGASARAAKALGYSTIQTYILQSEDGGSLRASGWVAVRTTAGGQWRRADGKPRRTDQPTEPKILYARRFLVDERAC